MTTSVLPFLTPFEEGTSPALPLFQEWECDAAGALKVIDGRMRLLSGLDAVKVWAQKALRTPLARFAAYGTDHGSELEDLVGQPYSEAFIRAEARRMVSEALLASPYITQVGDVTAAMIENGLLQITGSFQSVYGVFEVGVMV